MRPDSFSDALGNLDPASRALLDLSLRRGMRTEEIADMLGADPDSIALSRDEALMRVAADMGMSGDDEVDRVRAQLAELPAEDWQASPVDARANGSGAGADETAVAEDDPQEPGDDVLDLDEEVAEPEDAKLPEAEAAVPFAEAEEELWEPETPTRGSAAETTSVAERAREAERRSRATEEQPRKAENDTRAREESDEETTERRRTLPILLAILAVAALAAGVIAMTRDGGGDTGGDSGAAAPSAPAEPNEPGEPAPPAEPGGEQPQEPDPDAPTPQRPEPTRMAAIGAGDTRGTVRIVGRGRRLEVKLRDLPPTRGGAYAVWLYSSVIDARPLGAARATKIDLDAKLPSNWRRYRYVDVSLEPNDGNVSHSGESVARAATRDLR